MPTLVMFWDQINPIGDPIAGLEIHNNTTGIEIPPDACGFRLQRPGQLWPEGWHFSPPGLLGSNFTFQSVSYSSSNPNISAGDMIEARGSVGGCAGSSGNYVFVTPLGSLGISGDDPVVAGAGAFVADFSTEEDITWLNFDGAEIEIEEPEGGPEPVELPPEFFEEPPQVKGCFRDFEGDLHCPEDADSAGQAASDLPGGGLAMFIAGNAQIVPSIVATEEIGGAAATVASGVALEIVCPAELRLEARFIKSASASAAIVRYRFRFAHGPMSTTFQRLVDQTGVTSFFHSVPIPLPVPQNPSGGGGNVGPAATELSIYRPPDEPPFPPSGPSFPAPDGGLTIEPLPDNEHKGSVRVEVVNGAEGIIASGWASYHLICAEGSGRPVVTPGLVGPGVVSLQATLNRWLEERRLPGLVLDGKFSRETERVVRLFQEESKLKVDAIVGVRTWRALLKRTRREKCH